jgi:hypothetical protein
VLKVVDVNNDGATLGSVHNASFLFPRRAGRRRQLNLPARRNPFNDRLARPITQAELDQRAVIRAHNRRQS